MAVLVEVDPERLVVRLTGADRLWALSAGVRAPTAAVTSVRPVSSAEAYARGAGWRLPGTFWPGLIMAGSYLSRTTGSGRRPAVAQHQPGFRAVRSGVRAAPRAGRASPGWPSGSPGGSAPG